MSIVRKAKAKHNKYLQSEIWSKKFQFPTQRISPQLRLLLHSMINWILQAFIRIHIWFFVCLFNLNVIFFMPEYWFHCFKEEGKKQLQHSFLGNVCFVPEHVNNFKNSFDQHGFDKQIIVENLKLVEQSMHHFLFKEAFIIST